MGLDMILILTELQQHKWEFESKLRASETALERKLALLTVREASVVVMENDDDANSGPQIVDYGDSRKQLVILKQVKRVRVRHRRRW